MRADDDAAPVRRGGRPSREEAEQLGEKILSVATELFLADGYGPTSVEAISAKAGIAKRTFYSRFADKQALFAAVIHRIIEGQRPPATTHLFEGGSTEEVLERLATLMLRAALSPPVLALHRLMVAEAARFPELAMAMTREGTAEEAVRGITGLLERDAVSTGRSTKDAPFAALQFMQMSIALPQRRALGLGKPLSKEEIEAWPKQTVALFLKGWRG